MPPASTPNPPTEAGSRVGELLSWGRERLAATRPAIEPREAALLLKSVLGVDEAVLRAHPERLVETEHSATFRGLLRRRATGEPAAYLTGEREFFGRRFRVDSRVLIPRPETELLVELALDEILPERPRVLDLGTGSGCLAITLAAELPEARVTAVDCSIGALGCASINARIHGVAERVRLLAADWTTALDLSGFDLVIVNPPYLSELEWHRCTREIREHEPRRALLAAEDGLAEYRRLTSAFADLRPGGRVLFEIGSTQADEVRALCGPILEGKSVQIHRDLSGLDRAVVGTRSSGP